MWEFQGDEHAIPVLSEVDYCRRRAIQEQVAAQNAACPTARKVHEELAAMYRFRVSMISDAWAEAGVAIALQRLHAREHAGSLDGRQSPPSVTTSGRTLTQANPRH